MHVMFAYIHGKTNSHIYPMPDDATRPRLLTLDHEGAGNGKLYVYVSITKMVGKQLQMGEKGSVGCVMHNPHTVAFSPGIMPSCATYACLTDELS